MTRMTIAQAVLEKTALDGMAAGVSAFFRDVTVAFQERPWLLLVVGVVVMFFIFRSRR